MNKHYISLAPHIARKLAEAIYDYCDAWGTTEIDGLIDLLSGETDVERFIEEIDKEVR